MWLTTFFAVAALASLTTGLKIVHFSDIHLDPFYGTPEAVGSCTTNASSQYGTLGCDSPPFLVSSALKEVAARSKLTNEPHIVVFTGDWVRHGTQNLRPRPMSEMAIIFNEASKIIQDALLDVPTIIPVFGLAVGNEDFYPDYNATQNNPMLGLYAEALVANGLMDAASAATMSACGYYALDIAGSSITLLVWNTVLYNSEATTTDKDPCGQFAWMEDQLQRAKVNNRVVYTVAHIGPILLRWRADFAATWQQILSSYANVVGAQLFGHIHATTLAAISGMAGTPMLVSGGITKISKTNSAFQMYSIDQNTYRITGWEQISLTPPTSMDVVTIPGTNGSAWSRTLDVGQLLGLGAISFEAFEAFAKAMQSNQTLFEAYLTVLGDGVLAAWMADKCNGALMAPLCRKGASCVITQNSLEGIVGCVLTGLEVDIPEARKTVTQFALALVAAYVHDD